MVAHVAGHKSVQKLEGPVVNRQAQDAHVVGVHHPVAKAHGLPLRHEARGTLAHRLQQGGVGVACQAGAVQAFGVVAVDDVVGQRSQRSVLAVGCKVLKVTKAHKAACHAGDDGSGLDFFAADVPWGASDAQRARCRHTQAVHGYAAQKLANAGAQYRTTIAHARVGRAACTLELDLPPRGCLTEQDGAPIAQLAGPDAKLVPAVHAGQGA